MNGEEETKTERYKEELAGVRGEGAYQFSDALSRIVFHLSPEGSR